MQSIQNIDKEAFRQARLSRDSRFDGIFFIAVKTTHIFVDRSVRLICRKKKMLIISLLLRKR